MNSLLKRKYINLNSLLINLQGISFSLLIFFPTNIPKPLKIILYTFFIFTFLPYSYKKISIQLNIYWTFLLFFTGLIFAVNTLLFGQYYLSEIMLQIFFNVIFIFVIYISRNLIT